MPVMVGLVRDQKGEPRKKAIGVLWNLCNDRSSVFYLLEQQVHVAVLDCIREAGPVFATISTNLLISFCRFPEAAAAVRSKGGVELLMTLLSSECIERLKAAFILSFLVGKDESSLALANGGSLLQSYPDLISMLVDVFTNTLASKGGKGYELGNFEVHSIVGAILALSISDANKAILVNAPLLPLLVRVLVMYRDNEPSIKLSYGGGEDLNSAEWAIECLLQLSFYHESDQELQDKYMTPQLGIAELMHALINLPEDRSPYLLGAEAKSNAFNLAKRLLALPPPPPSSSAAAGGGASPFKAGSKPQHVMLSYAWKEKKELVIALELALRDLNYEVWRDETGSALVTSMSGATDDRMAEAIEASAFVVVCVSSAYKESANCRMEAKYAGSLAKKGKTKLIFIMMDEYYTTHSENSLDGWLAFMVG